MATAGTPPSRKPSSARAASKVSQLGARLAARLHSAASSIETNIRPRRPSPSDSAPASTMATARQPVVSDSDSALAAGVTPKCATNAGSSGCTQYSSEKVAKPARNSARLMRR